ncbi:MAG: hypothetical protein ACREVL_15730 [Solimonas sp.]
MKKLFAALLLGGLALLTGCSTTGHFITPPNTQLVVMGRNLDVPADGVVTTAVLLERGRRHSVPSRKRWRDHPVRQAAHQVPRGLDLLAAVRCDLLADGFQRRHHL